MQRPGDTDAAIRLIKAEPIEGEAGDATKPRAERPQERVGAKARAEIVERRAQFYAALSGNTPDAVRNILRIYEGLRDGTMVEHIIARFRYKGPKSIVAACGSEDENGRSVTFDYNTGTEEQRITFEMNKKDNQVTMNDGRGDRKLPLGMYFEQEVKSKLKRNKATASTQEEDLGFTIDDEGTDVADANAAAPDPTLPAAPKSGSRIWYKPWTWLKGKKKK
jgi:hypothetical protein